MFSSLRVALSAKPNQNTIMLVLFCEGQSEFRLDFSNNVRVFRNLKLITFDCKILTFFQTS